MGMFDSIIGSLDNLTVGDLGAVGSTALGFLGAQQQNQSNWDIAQSNNQFSAQQFANRYQTTVQDLTKAGLNPMLAYGQGGGSPPTAAPVPPMQNRMASAMSAYNERRANDAMVALQADQAAAAKAQANASTTQAGLNSANTNLSNVNALKVIQETAKSEQDTKTSAASEASLRESINLINEQIQTQKTQQRLNSANAAVQAIEADIRKNELYKRNVTRAPYEWVDQNIIKQIKPYLQLPSITVTPKK